MTGTVSEERRNGRKEKRASFDLFDKQIEVVQTVRTPKVRKTLVIGAQQSGKTIGGAVAMLNRISEAPKGEFVLGAPTGKLLWSGTLKKFLDWANKFPDFIASHHRTKAEIWFSNGAVLYYRTYDAGVEAWESMTLDGAWIDEAQRMPEELYKELANRLSVKLGFQLITARVPDPQNLRNHWLYPMYRAAINNPHGPTRYIQFTAFDNPYYPQSEIEEKRRTLPPAEFQAWVEGRMDLTVKDDHLFPGENVKACMKRFDTAFTEIPEPLQRFVWERGLSYVPDDVLERFNADPFGVSGTGGGAAGENIVDIGVDVAAYGGDYNVVAYHYALDADYDQGEQDGITFAIENWGASDPHETGSKLVEVGTDLWDRGFYPRFWVDAIQVGESICPVLREANLDAVEVRYSEKAHNKQRYDNRKAEAYFKLMEKVKSGKVVLPPMGALEKQMQEQRYEHHSGRLRVMKQEPSPDHLDAVVFANLSTEAATLPLHV